MDAYTFFFLIIFASYILLYITGKFYLHENFTTEKKACKGTIVEFEEPVDKPYVSDSISAVDDYEHNLVFRNEGSRELSDTLKNKLMSQYPLDWSVQPPSSMKFQEGHKKQVEGYENAPPVSTQPSPFVDIENDMKPPDTTALEMEERKLLQTYNPTKNTKNQPTEYNLHDAEDLIKKIYDKKGLIPEVRKRENHVYEVIGTRSKNEKIIYEDEPEGLAQDAHVTPASDATDTTNNVSLGENTIVIPQKARDIAAGNDPYYNTTTQTRTGKWDYMRWTPGLERMFAPSTPVNEWY